MPSPGWSSGGQVEVVEDLERDVAPDHTDRAHPVSQGVSADGRHGRSSSGAVPLEFVGVLVAHCRQPLPVRKPVLGRKILGERARAHAADITHERSHVNRLVAN